MPTQDYGDVVLDNGVTYSFEDVCETVKFKQIHWDMQQGVTLCRETCNCWVSPLSSFLLVGIPTKKNFDSLWT